MLRGGRGGRAGRMASISDALHSQELPSFIPTPKRAWRSAARARMRRTLTPNSAARSSTV